MRITVAGEGCWPFFLPAACPDPQVTTRTVTSRYGMARAAARDRVHPRLTHRASWLDHDGDLPVIEGTLIRLQVGYLPGDRDPKPVWLWWSRTSAARGWTGAGSRSCAAPGNGPQHRDG